MGDIFRICAPWREFFMSEEMQPLVQECFTHLKNLHSFTPELRRVFYPFLCPPSAVKVIIVGQDPYTELDRATGLAFANFTRVVKSGTSTGYNPSLINIMKLAHCSDPTLLSWFFQGVFLINTVLTASIDGLHGMKEHAFWRPLVRKAIEHICDVHQGKMILILWGKVAQDEFSYLSDKARIFTWSHPSPAADNAIKDASRQFQNCTNLSDANSTLMEWGARIIVWNTRQFEYGAPPFLVFTDGGCTANGRLNSSGRWAYVILRRLGADGSYEHVTTESQALASDIEHTNNVAELTAMQRAFQDPHLATSIKDFGYIGVVSDSGYSINAVSGVNKAAKNVELIASIRDIVSNANVAFKHVNSHTNKNPPPITTLTPATYDAFFTYWNHVVDRAADPR